jgi:tetratricopeptide (TPR) repeat protein
MSNYYYRLAVVSALLLVTSSPVWADDYDDAARLLKQGNTAAALKKADAAIAANKDDPRPRFLKGLILTERNETQAAIDVFTSLTRDYPELPEPYNNLAVLYAAQGQYDQARESLEMAIRTHPSYAVAHENLGDVYAKMASEAYDKALSLDRSNQTAQTKLSLIRELFVGTGSLAQVETAAAAPKPSPTAPKPAQTTSAPKPATASAPKPSASSTPKPTQTAAAPKPAATSAPKPSQTAASSTPAGNQQTAVVTAVSNWAQAWSEQDVTAYLSHYAPNFDPPGELSRSDWEKQRRSRVSRPKLIQVEVTEPKVSFNGAESAVVRFRQHYKSDTIDSTGYKTLTMTRSNQGWLIVREQFEN